MVQRFEWFGLDLISYPALNAPLSLPLLYKTSSSPCRSPVGADRGTVMVLTLACQLHAARVLQVPEECNCTTVVNRCIARRWWRNAKGGVLLPYLFPGSDQIKSNRIGSNRIESNRIGSDRIGPDRIGS